MKYLKCNKCKHATETMFPGCRECTRANSYKSFSPKEDAGNSETLWQLNLEALKMGAFGNPLAPEALLRYWKAQEAAGYPHASENVKYWEIILGVKEDEADATVQ